MLDIPNNQVRRQALYMLLAAVALYMFIEGVDLKSIPKDCFELRNDHYCIHDYVGVVSLLISGLTGFGDTPVTKTWSSLDIQTTLDHILGFGYSIANRLLWEGSTQNWQSYYLFCMFLGFAMARVKPVTMDYQLIKYINQDRLVTERFNLANHANFDSIGSISGLVFPMPRNDLKWKGQSVLPFPALMDMRAIEQDKDVFQRANMYDNLLKVNGKSFSTITVTKGEIPPNSIDPMSLEQKWFFFKSDNDARIVEEEYELRSVFKYKFPRWGIARNNMPDYMKRFLWMIGLFTNGDRALKVGYLSDVGMQILTPVHVTYYRTSLMDTVIVKEGSDMKTDTDKEIIHQPKPTAGMTGPSVVNTQSEPTEIPQPPAQEEVPEKDHKDTLSGGAPGENPPNEGAPPKK
jgi:hypothetical protein